jgi:hypothetical protein
MTLSPFVVLIAIAAFLISGLVKGVIGMGLLSLVMTPADAAVLLVVPTLVTNVWQLAFGPGFRPLLKRLGSFLVATTVVAFLSSGLLATDRSGRAAALLGVALIIYSVLGLCAVRMKVPPHAEPWLGPLTGAASGLVTGATGVSGVPAVIYLNGLGLDKEELIQALGITSSSRCSHWRPGFGATACSTARSLAPQRSRSFRRCSACWPGSGSDSASARQCPHLLLRRIAAARCSSRAAHAPLNRARHASESREARVARPSACSIRRRYHTRSHLPPPVITERTALLAATTHMLCYS